MEEHASTRTFWDAGSFPLGMVALGYATSFVPVPCCGGGMLVIPGGVTAILFLVWDRRERQPTSRAAVAALALALAFPLWMHFIYTVL